MSETNRIQTLIQDVYQYINGNPEIGEQDPNKVTEHIAAFIRDMHQMAEKFILERTKPPEPFRLRPSNLGTPARKLWFLKNAPIEDEPTGPAHRPLTFLYGNMTEALLLFLVRMTGKHKVEDFQKQVSLAGVEGSMDVTIDDVPVDVKSASPYGFAKFKDGSLASNNDEQDPFGYRDQLAFYAGAEDKKDAAWLAMDKSSGELSLLTYDHMKGMKTKKGVESYVKKTQEMLERDEPPPELCYQPTPMGKAGNEEINRLCVMCPYKMTGGCFPQLRAFKYANGIKYLSKVVKTPDVEEIYL